jgi:hypothetical protein
MLLAIKFQVFLEPKLSILQYLVIFIAFSDVTMNVPEASMLTTRPPKPLIYTWL